MLREARKNIKERENNISNSASENTQPTNSNVMQNSDVRKMERIFEKYKTNKK